MYSLNFPCRQAYNCITPGAKNQTQHLGRPMVTLLFTAVLVLGLLAIAIYFWQKPANTSQSIEPLPPYQPQGLFSDFRLNELQPATADQLSTDNKKVTTEDFEQAVDAIRSFQKSPNRSSTAKLLHVTALTDDARNYERAIELVLMSWRDGSLADMSAKDLQTLLNSEYWVLSSSARTSGAGFVLKRTLSNASRELESTNNNNPQLPTLGERDKHGQH